MIGIVDLPQELVDNVFGGWGEWRVRFHDDGHGELQTRMVHGAEWISLLASKYVADIVNNNAELDRFLRVEFDVLTGQTISALKDGAL